MNKIPFARRFTPIIAVFAVAGWCAGADAPGHDWPQFGWDVASSSASGDATGITAANVGSLVRHQVALNGTVDASAIYLHNVTV